MAGLALSIAAAREAVDWACMLLAANGYTGNVVVRQQADAESPRLNAVQQQVTVMQGSLGTGARLGHWMGWMALGEVQPIQGQAAFDLIVANILARVHIALTHDYRRALMRPGEHTGILITAGYTAERTAALAEAGFELIDRQQAEEWVALAHRLPA